MPKTKLNNLANFLLRILLLLAGLYQTPLIADTSPESCQEAISEEVEEDTNVQIIGQTFLIKQTWVMTGISVDQALVAVTKLRLTGRYGIYQDSVLLSTVTPEDRQNIDGRVRAEKVRPTGLPEFVGSTASTSLTTYGFIAQMSDGPIGRGRSIVTIETAKEKGGCPSIILRENGEFSLSPTEPSVYNLPLRIFLWSPPGRLMQASWHRVMGGLHNTVFNPGAAIANIINDGI